ncbi:hypothetical protein [Streptomyces sp. YIM B13518]|uniref:hypothetical protein n=1 Tax=Streptomyces sp. YIM B13518 TaxID=3366316 RepID=UPI0036C02E9E
MHRIPRGSLAALIALALGAALTAAVTGGNPSGGRGTGTPAPAEAARPASRTFSMTTLEDGTVYRVDLTPDGQDVSGVTELITEENRFRDTEFSAYGMSLFVTTDSAGPVRDERGAPSTGPLENPGAVIEYRFQG